MSSHPVQVEVESFSEVPKRFPDLGSEKGLVFGINNFIESSFTVTDNVDVLEFETFFLSNLNAFKNGKKFCLNNTAIQV